MLVAYHMSVHDDGTHMLGPDTFRVPPNTGYYDWRFGRDGTPHAAACPTCGGKTDPDYINPQFRARRRGRDLTATSDGYVLVSGGFRKFCETNDWHQDVQFTPLPADDSYFVFRPCRTVEFDVARRKTRLEDLCPECKKYFNVVGATPVFLRNIGGPITEGFFRTDLEFASGHEQHSLVIVGIKTAEAMRRHAFEKIELETIHA